MLSPLEGEHDRHIKCISFNQDYSSIAMGTKYGYSLYSIHDEIHKLEKTFYSQEQSDIYIVEQLFSTSLIVVVSLLSQQKLRLYHIKRKIEISSRSYKNIILSLKLNRRRLVVCLKDELHIHSVKDNLNLRWVIRDVPPNPNGVFALCSKDDRPYLAYPVSHTQGGVGGGCGGAVQLFDTIKVKNLLTIQAHDNPLAALSFNHQGTMLASASEKGTVIRVHLVEDGRCLYEFRRGYARCVDIYSLSFSLDSVLLAATSSTETVHIFKLEQTVANNCEEVDDAAEHSNWDESPSCDELTVTPGAGPLTSWGGYLGKAIARSSSYISSHMNDILNQWRSFAVCRLPYKQLRNACAITHIDGLLRVVVVSSVGFLYIYNLDINSGGNCTLVKQHLLDEAVVEPASHHSEPRSTMHQEAPGVNPPRRLPRDQDDDDHDDESTTTSSSDDGDDYP